MSQESSDLSRLIASFEPGYGRTSRSRPETAAWQPLFATGMGHRQTLDENLFDFGRNVGRFCTVPTAGWRNLNHDADNLVHTLRDAIRSAHRTAERLAYHARGLSTEDRNRAHLLVSCDVTKDVNLRCQVFPQFGRDQGPPGFTHTAYFDTPDTYFLHVMRLYQVFHNADADLQPVVADMSALVVIAFEECLNAFRKHFVVVVRTAPALHMQWGGTHPLKRVNLGLKVEAPEATLAREEEMKRVDDIGRSDALLASFASTFPEGSPEHFVQTVEAAPAKSTRISVVHELGRVGYVSGEKVSFRDMVRAQRGIENRLAFDNRSLMSLVGDLIKALDRARPDWRSEPSKEPVRPARARKLNQRGA